MARQEPIPGREHGLSWAELSRRVAAGDEAAFTAFYEAWFPVALSFARKASGRDEAFCLDVVQDVMLTVARKLPPLADEAAVGAWMRKTVLRRIVDRVRRETRTRRREERRAASVDSVGAEPWSGLALREQREWLADRLAELPLEERELLMARFSPAISVRSAGALLGMGADAAHGRLRRVLERLRRKAVEWMS